MAESTLDLFRSDLYQVGSITSRNTIRVLPFGKQKRQKYVLKYIVYLFHPHWPFRVVVGDDTGSVACFEIKKNDIKPIFKTLPSEADKRIGCLTLGGAYGCKDKIFTADGSKVRGITKKGREFFTYITNFSDDITYRSSS